jgi:hypothetical protein
MLVLRERTPAMPGREAQDNSPQQRDPGDGGAAAQPGQHKRVGVVDARHAHTVATGERRQDLAPMIHNDQL